MEQYKTAEGVSSNHSSLDNFLQQLDFKLGRLAEIKERLENKVEKIYGIKDFGSLDKTDGSPVKPIFIPTEDTLGYKLDHLELLLVDINILVDKIEGFI